MTLTLFKNAKLLDPTAADLQDGVSVLVAGDRIPEVSPRPIRAAGATVVDVGGRTLMPGLIDCHVPKNTVVLEAGLRSLELAKRAGVRMAFGSDLLGQLQPDQSQEFLLRGALSPQEIVHSATIVAAELLGRPGELGVIAPGALADLLVVDGNPLKDLGLFQEQGAHIPVVMQGGRFHRNRLAPDNRSARGARRLLGFLSWAARA
jgi:imidazolonepropionase-like amidohydrolase